MQIYMGNCCKNVRFFRKKSLSFENMPTENVTKHATRER